MVRKHNTQHTQSEADTHSLVFCFCVRERRPGPTAHFLFLTRNIPPQTHVFPNGPPAARVSAADTDGGQEDAPCEDVYQTSLMLV